MEKIKLNKIKSVYFLGIGGIGMSAIAEYMLLKKKKVFGYDKTPTSLTKRLEQAGAVIHYQSDITKIPDNLDLVVYTPAIPADFDEFVFLQKSNIRIVKRSEMLGEISRGNYNVCIGGTHGKTTITAMVAHILTCSDIKCTAFIGGIAKNYDSNLIVPAKKSEYMIEEADEYDKSFMQLHPNIAVVSSIEPDHLDVYGDNNALTDSFQDFIDKVDSTGDVIKKYGLNIYHDNEITYSFDNKDADYFPEDLVVEQNSYRFSVGTPSGKLENIVMSYPGLHNIENAVAAIAIAEYLSVKDEDIIAAIKTFKGVRRRFDIQINNDNFLYIDDYAHHPTEIKRAVESVKHFTNNKPILGIFQPHLYSRTRDFADDFARSLSMLDNLILLDIYPAREEPIQGIDAEFLLAKCTNKKKQICQKNELIHAIENADERVIITMGAGDISDCADDIKQYFSK